MSGCRARFHSVDADSFVLYDLSNMILICSGPALARACVMRIIVQKEEWVEEQQLGVKGPKLPRWYRPVAFHRSMISARSLSMKHLQSIPFWA